MDISINENTVEKVKLRDIITSLKDVVFGNKINKDEDAVTKKIQEINQVEKELGATDSIEKLIKELETHETSKKRRTGRKSTEIQKSIEIPKSRNNNEVVLSDKEIGE